MFRNNWNVGFFFVLELKMFSRSSDGRSLFITVVKIVFLPAKSLCEGLITHLLIE